MLTEMTRTLALLVGAGVLGSITILVAAVTIYAPLLLLGLAVVVLVFCAYIVGWAILEKH